MTPTEFKKIENMNDQVLYAITYYWMLIVSFSVLIYLVMR